MVKKKKYRVADFDSMQGKIGSNRMLKVPPGEEMLHEHCGAC